MMQGFYENSGKLVSMLQPRIKQAVENTWDILHLDMARPEVTLGVTTYALYATIFLELVGGVCFMFFPRAGGLLLALYLVSITRSRTIFTTTRPGLRLTPLR